MVDEHFEANPMKGTSFDFDDDDEVFRNRFKNDGKMRSLETIKDMVEQLTQRLKYYETQYVKSKRENNRELMIISLRNYKAIEGARQSLKWVIRVKGVEHPLF